MGGDECGDDETTGRTTSSRELVDWIEGHVDRIVEEQVHGKGDEESDVASQAVACNVELLHSLDLMLIGVLRGDWG